MDELDDRLRRSDPLPPGHRNHRTVLGPEHSWST
jgi:hypothetical protein